ncbi:MAG: phosphoribosylaminoimidazolesuccinocarboxamide synthase [Candidatus Bathyarchaeia archaeon]
MSDVVLETKLSHKLWRRGKVRDIYELPNKHLLIVATDRISAFDVIMPNGIPGKGKALHALSIHWLQKTQPIIRNHLVASVDDRSMEAVRAERIDIEFVARGYLYGSVWRSYDKGNRVICGVKLPNGLRMAEELPETILTPTTKAEAGHDLEMSREDALSRHLVTAEEWRVLEEATLKLYEFYKRDAAQRGIIIPDFKLEYGRLDGGLIQIDEPPTHDSARFWAKKYYKVGQPQEAHALDKEFLRQYLLKVGYRGDGPPPTLPPRVVEQIALRCTGAFEVLTGKASIEKFALKSVDDVVREEKGAGA